jgi:hypothetical protein
MIIEKFLAKSARAYRRTYGLKEQDYGSVMVCVGNISLKIIGNSDGKRAGEHLY